jgi:hypothetical protein
MGHRLFSHRAPGSTATQRAFPSSHFPLLAKGGGHGGPFGKPDESGVDRDTKMREHSKIPIDRMRQRRGSGHGDVVESRRAFAPVLKADREPTVGQPGHDGASGQALQIDYPVKLPAANVAKTPAGFAPIAGRGPPPPVKRDNPRQVGIAFQQRSQSLVKPPENFSLGTMQLDEPQHGQRLHHVAQRAGFEDEDFQGRKT